MANAEWPAALPQSAFVDNWQETIEDSAVEFAVEVGPPKRRRRISSPQRLIEHTLVITVAQRAALMTFYESTLVNGTLYFDWIHPIDGGSAVTWQFREPPSTQLISGTHFTASLKLRKIP